MVNSYNLGIIANNDIKLEASRHLNSLSEVKPKPDLSTNHLNRKQEIEKNIRRRSSAKLIYQLNGSRRLSSIPHHSLALALELKRKSLKFGDLEKNDSNYIDSNKSPVDCCDQEMSFTSKCVYTFIMLLIHHNFVRYSDCYKLLNICFSL